MATLTITKFGPGDHGVELSYDDFMAADYEEGFRYELIDGRLFVVPIPGLPENSLETWLRRPLERYVDAHPEVINYVSPKTRVFVPSRSDTTCPEPDIAAYADFPHELSLQDRRWEDIFPVLVIEVMTRDAWKDLVRNVELYLQVSTIREYWVLDGSSNPDEPTLIQHRRRGKRWVVRRFPYGSKFTTKLLPGFKLVIDPRRPQ